MDIQKTHLVIFLSYLFVKQKLLHFLAHSLARISLSAEVNQMVAALRPYVMQMSMLCTCTADYFLTKHVNLYLK